MDPPIAAFTIIAFSNAARVRILDKVISSLTISTIRLPDNWESTLRRASAAGIEALSGNESPNASTITAIVEAVPITAQ